MKCVFEEKKIYGGYSLEMHLEDVPTLEGDVIALETFFEADFGSSDWLIKQIKKVLNGEEEVLDSGGNMFDFIATKDKTVVECIFENYGWKFTISTEVLYEIAVTWHKGITEFNEKYKKKHFWRIR